MSKNDIGVSLLMCMKKLKEVDVKEYSSEGSEKDLVYVFDSLKEYWDYFDKNGVEVDPEIIKMCILKTTIKGKVIAFKGLCDHYITVCKQKQNIERIKATYDIDYTDIRLNKISNRCNTFEVSERLIDFYPPNDGRACRPLFFNKNGVSVIDNDNAFANITNLDEILIKMVDIFDKALDNEDIFDSYGFMLRLTDPITKNYNGRAELVCTDRTLLDIDENHRGEAKIYFTNKFLDHFMGWNFGVAINKSDELREALEKFNYKVIDRGMRLYSGPGLDVYGTEDFPVNGVQHYYLPLDKKDIIHK